MISQAVIGYKMQSRKRQSTCPSIMAECSKSDHHLYCSCHGPAWKFLEDFLSKNERLCSTAGKKKIADPDLKPASIMYSGGTIRPITNGNANETVDAIGFYDGRVLAVGCKDKVEKAMNEVAADCYVHHSLENGQTLLPGLIEPHVHIVLNASLSAGWNDFSPFCGQKLREGYTPEWLKAELKNVKDKLKNDYWILGQGVDPSLMPFLPKNEKDNLNVLQNFNVDSVDFMMKDTPVMMLSASGHSLYVNTAALHCIHNHDPNEGETFECYRYRVNSTGGLQEDQVFNAFNAVPMEQQQELLKGLNKGLDEFFDLALDRGVTMLYDAGMNSTLKKKLDCYFKECTDSTLVPRVGYAEIINDPKQVASLPKFESIKFESPYQGSIKIVSDGSNQGLTGYQPEGTYRCEPKDNIGIFNFELGTFRKMVREVAREKKWPMMIHANGINAIKETIGAYDKALEGKYDESQRHRIEHCSLSSKHDLQKMADLGISPSFLIGHVGYWGYAFTGIFEENSKLLDQCQTALKKGMRITFHSDYFVTPLGPLRMMEQAITRIMEQDPQRKVLNADERLTPVQALKAVTFDAAWQCHADKWVGSLEAPTHYCNEGKMADYVILSEDPVKRKNPVGIRDIAVLETWVGGIKLKDLKKSSCQDNS